MASDWEEAKYSYVAISTFPSDVETRGRVAGPIKIQKGFLEVPVLTKETLETLRVMKRDKDQYNYVKELKWGDLLYRNVFGT